MNIPRTVCGARLVLQAALALIVFSLTACVGHRHQPYDGPTAGTAPASAGHRIYPLADLGADFAPGTPPAVTNADLGERDSRHYTVKHIGFDSVGDNGQPGRRVDVNWYRGRAAGRLPAVIVLPIWGSYTYPSNRIAAGLRKRGEGRVHVLHVQGANRVLDWTALESAATEKEFLRLMAGNLERFRTNVVDVSRLVDWAAERPEIDPARIGLVGFSHSAITASLAAINEPRLRATVVVMAGSHPDGVFADCDGHVGQLRETITGRFGWTDAEYRERLKPMTQFVDSANYPGLADPASVLMIDAERDQCFSREARDTLWRVLGEPERYTMAYSHKISFLAITPLGLNWLRQPIYGFFEQRLDWGG